MSKKAEIFITAVLLVLLTAFASFASGTMDLARAGASDLETLRASVKAGTRLFDQAGMLNAEEQEETEKSLQELQEACGMDMAVITVVNQTAASDLESYCDLVYAGSGLGRGSDRSGILFVVDLGDSEHRGFHLYAQGEAARYMTDSAITELFTELGGGIYEPFSEGRYYDALELYADSVETICARGIPEGQYNYDPETGKTDVYRGKRRLAVWQILLSILISAGAGAVPVLSVKRQYAMVSERKQAQKVNLAYRASAVFRCAETADVLVNRTVRHIPIPRQEAPHGGPGHGPGHGSGGGRSTVHRSSGGGHHSSGGMRF